MRSLHLKITLNGIKNNLKIYIPYVLVCSLMICISNILLQTINFPSMTTGRDIISAILYYGCGIIAIFSLFFLFYANGIISKTRITEYGLYNLLGFSKKNLCLINLLETLTIYISSMLIGLSCGLLLSKLSEILYAKLCHSDFSFELNIDTIAFVLPIFIFGAIFVLTFIKNVIQILSTNPIKLIKASRVGDKPPKANFLIGFIGLILLIVSFYFAVHLTENVLESIFIFFFCAIGVIISTYMIFISLSVVICKIMQKNKKFYYRKNHFISISMLSFRMKKNGAGLASISIFLTVIFIACTLSFCIYNCCEKEINTICHQDAKVSTFFKNTATQNEINDFEKNVINTAKDNNLEINNINTYSYTIGGAKLENKNEIKIENNLEEYTNNIFTISVISLEDLNKYSNNNVTLVDDKVMLYTIEDFSDVNKINVNDVIVNTIKGEGVLAPMLEFGAKDVRNLKAVVVCSNPDYLNSLRTNSYSIQTETQFDTDVNSSNYFNFTKNYPNADKFIQHSDTKQEISKSAYGLYGVLVFIGG